MVDMFSFWILKTVFQKSEDFLKRNIMFMTFSQYLHNKF